MCEKCSPSWNFMHSQFEIIRDCWVAQSQNEPIRWHMLFVLANLFASSASLLAVLAQCCQGYLLASCTCHILLTSCSQPTLPCSVSCSPCPFSPSLLSPSATAFSSAQHHCPVLPFPRPCPELCLSLQAPKAPLSS